VMADIAVHEGATFDRLACSGLLHIDARALPRDYVTDEPVAVEARLRGRTVAAPHEANVQVSRLYDGLAAHPIPGPLPKPEPASPLAAAALVIARPPRRSARTNPRRTGWQGNVGAGCYL